MTRNELEQNRTGTIFQYRGIPIHAPIVLHEKTVEWLKTNIRDDATIADIGCGCGGLTQRLVDEGYNVVAIDMDMSDYAAKGADAMECDISRCADLLRDYEFDCVIALEVIEHTFNPVEFLKCLKIITKKYIIISFPNIHEAHNLLTFTRNGEFCWWNRDAYDQIGHKSIIIDWLFIKYCETAGLEVREIHYLDEITPHRIRSHLFRLAMIPLCLLGIGKKKRVAGSVLAIADAQ